MFALSHMSVGVQLADIIAGAIWLSFEVNDLFWFTRSLVLFGRDGMVSLTATASPDSPRRVGRVQFLDAIEAPGEESSTQDIAAPQHHATEALLEGQGVDSRNERTAALVEMTGFGHDPTHVQALASFRART